VIFLSGLMGSGKTTVGRMLAKKLGWRFTDTDLLVARRSRRSVAKIFSQDGERHFRALESQALRSLQGRKRLVVAAGGGLVLKAANRQWMRRQGVVVWLDMSPRQIVKRLNPAQIRKRPLLKAGPAALLRLAAQRRPVYAKAQLKVNAAQAPARVAAEILRKIGEKAPWVLHDKTAR